MIISSWNVNSVRARIENIKSYLLKYKPDIVMMQEIKTEDINFPYDDFSAMDYESHVFGQKSYNGVAIISKKKLPSAILLEIKRKQKAFHPNAKRLNINLGSKIFCYERISLDKKQTIICISNLSTKLQYIKINKNLIKYRDLLGRKIFFTFDKKIKLDPCQTIWLSNR